MQKTIAYMNYGRWLHNCPKCSTALPVERHTCPICYPDMTATLYEEVPTRRGKTFRRVPDHDKQEQARAQAEAKNERYQAVFPAERQQIERILRSRKREHMNWTPGESVDSLVADNIKHNDPLPKEIKDGI